MRSAVARGDDDVDLLILINSNKKDDEKLQLLFRGRPDQDLARDTDTAFSVILAKRVRRNPTGIQIRDFRKKGYP